MQLYQTLPHTETEQEVWDKFLVSWEAWKKDIDALVAYCKKVPSKVNLIEYNAIEEDGFVQADEAAIAYYQRELERNNITVNIRHSRGKDIDAACGQLANKTTA